jgi:fatty acid desaturase
MKPTPSDYTLNATNTERAQAQGLVNADWYKSPVPRAVMKDLMQRNDHMALRDTALWLSLVVAAGVLAVMSWGTAWALPAFLLYGALYCGPADSRWHESGHGTAFKTPWMSKALYQLASFMVLRRPTVWRWSHARHHSDTLVRGRDPEIAVPVPPSLGVVFLNLFALKGGMAEWGRVLRNATGRLSESEKTFIPEMEWPKVIREARIWVVLALMIAGACVAMHSPLPVLLVGLPSFYGAWLYNFFGFTQHAGLPENVTDHRLNCRTVYMNPLFRFLYWNMNYHLEHHMFPMVPYHALPRLHEVIKADSPPAYPSTWAAYKELVPAVLKQTQDPHYHVHRPAHISH